MRALVIGGGIIGASCAAMLTERGAQVRVVDAGKPRFGTSLQNAGHIVVSHSIPFAAPGMVRAGIRSLLTSDGAFAFSSRPGRGTLPWLLGFARKCTATNVASLHPGLDLLLHRSAELLMAEGNLARTGPGLWQVFTSSSQSASQEAEHLRAHGVHVRDIPFEELRAEPGLTDQVVAAIELVEDFGVDPAALWLRMRERSEAAGAVWEEGIELDLRDQDADVIVIAAGAWSPAIVRPLGVDLPIRAAKGYSVSIAGVEDMPTRPMLLMDQRTALNPLGDRLRLSARYEITGPDDREIVAHRIAGLIERARTVVDLPERVADVEPWTGVRPASIDGAPYIGFLPQRSATPVVVATGHGMIGTALSAGTADLVTRLIFGDHVDEREARLGPDRLLT
ncbi:MAG TPA: FAD-dependent oxidoreductase [Candidatus Nanopelagicales bacterium]|nr:FAD-dependent oxidoreductase [Candidatus Nanopelagicales bacterium]